MLAVGARLDVTVSTASALVTLPLSAEGRRTRGAHAEGHRRAGRDRAAGRLRRDRGGGRPIGHPVDHTSRTAADTRQVIQAAVVADLQVDGPGDTRGEPRYPVAVRRVETPNPPNAIKCGQRKTAVG